MDLIFVMLRCDLGVNPRFVMLRSDSAVDPQFCHAEVL